MDRWKRRRSEEKRRHPNSHFQPSRVFSASSISTKKTSVKGGVKDERDGDENGHPSKTIKIISTRRVARQPLANKGVIFPLSKKPLHRRRRTRNASYLNDGRQQFDGMEKEKKDQRTFESNQKNKVADLRRSVVVGTWEVFVGERRFASKNNLVTRVAPSTRLTIPPTDSSGQTLDKPSFSYSNRPSLLFTRSDREKHPFGEEN